MKSRLLALIICVAWSGIASAVPKFINAAGDNSFTNALNWDSALVPGPADVVTGGADQAKLWTGDIATWASTLSIGSSSSSTGELTVEGGTLGATYTFNIATFGDGVVTVNGGDVTSLRFIDIGYNANKTGTLNMNGGSMQTTSYDIDIGRVADALGILNMSGGHLTAKRWFQIGEAGTGVMTMTGGTNTVIDYDVSLGKVATGSGTLNMYGGYWDVNREFLVGELGAGVMTMTNGVISVNGAFVVAETAGSSGQLNFSGGTIYAADFEIGAGTNAPGMVAFSGTAKMILTGNKVSSVQPYIDAGYVTGASATYILTNDTTIVGEAPPQPPPEQLPAGMLARFDFDNHIAGALIPGTDPSPRPLADRGATFDYVSNGADSNTTLSVLREFGPSRMNTSYDVYVCEDTLHNNEPGGNFIAISPYRLADLADGDIDPTNIASNDYFQFSIQADSNKITSLDSFSFDMASYVVTSNSNSFITNALTFRAQAWYALPDGVATNWVKMHERVVLSTTNAQDWVGFTNITVDLSGIPELQGVEGEIMIALAMSDNNSRPTHIFEEDGTAEYYLDNINLYGTVSELSNQVTIQIENGHSILTWDSTSSGSYNVLTNTDLLLPAGWGLDDTVPGLGGSMSWTSAVLSADHMFYKIEIAP